MMFCQIGKPNSMSKCSRKTSFPKAVSDVDETEDAEASRFNAKPHAPKLRPHLPETEGIEN